MMSDLAASAQLVWGAGGHDGPLRHNRVDALEPEASGGRVSASPLLGHSDIARSARAVIMRDGFTPGLAGMTLPSMTCSPG